MQRHDRREEACVQDRRAEEESCIGQSEHGRAQGGGADHEDHYAHVGTGASVAHNWALLLARITAREAGCAT
jgi:hypothetical protein